MSAFYRITSNSFPWNSEHWTMLLLKQRFILLWRKLLGFQVRSGD